MIDSRYKYKIGDNGEVSPIVPTAKEDTHAVNLGQVREEVAASDSEVVKTIETADGQTLEMDENGKVILPDFSTEGGGVHAVFVDEIYDGGSLIYTVTDSAKVTHVSLDGSGLREGFEWQKLSATEIKILIEVDPGSWVKIEGSNVAAGTSGKGELSTGNIKLDLSAGRFYGDNQELTGNITIDDASAQLGGTALIYHKDSTAPTITTNLEKITIPVNGEYVPNESNLIALSKIGSNRLGIVYNQITGVVNEPPTDITAPSVPTGLTISNITDTSATATWNASTDD